MCLVLCSMLGAKQWIRQSLTLRGVFHAAGGMLQYSVASLQAKEGQAGKASWRR